MKMQPFLPLAVSAAGVFLMGLSGPLCPKPQSSSLNIPPKIQETRQWCWAASGQMTMNYVKPGLGLTQCAQANKAFPMLEFNCCNTPPHNFCVMTGWPDYKGYGFNADMTVDKALTWAQVRNQIHCKKKPFAFSWHIGGGGHMMVAIGYSLGNDQRRYVEVNNPDPDVANHDFYLYEKYKGGNTYPHTHWNDYYNITYVGPGT